MMKKNIIIIVLLSMATFAAAKYDVVGLKLYIEGGNTVAEAITTGPTTIKTATFENPDRLVIDLIGGVHRLKEKKLPPLPPGIVVEVRSAQFQGEPNPITRIVLVLAEPVGETKIEDGPRSGKVFIPTPGYPEFEVWSIGMSTPSKAPVEAPSEVKKPAAETAKKEPKKPKEEKPPPSKKPKAKQPPAESAAEPKFQRVYMESDTAHEGASYIRPLVVYNGWGNPDPFVTAKPASKSVLGEEAFPMVEGLKLVGIVIGSESNKIGVLQDARGWGYILGVGDSVKDGVVDAISDTTIVFDIEEYGVIRQVTLELPKEVSGR
ncbi:AMIN domain-containing protein [bacterium]|nr:AMIN domain-containing protein [bacterium]